MDFYKNLISFLENAKVEYQNDEWYFSKFDENTTNSMTSFESFDAIDCVVTILVKEEYSEYFTEIFQILLSLIRKSETTEIPTLLVKYWEKIKQMCLLREHYNKNKFEELKTWYKI
jgi:hypothetical protein